MPDFNLGPEIAKTRHVVIVDGDPAMREMVARYFEEHSIPVSAVSNRAGLSRHLAVMYPCLILLEVRLGQDDGLDVLREIRAHSDVPIIMTGHRLDETDRVVGLEIGADDCIVKPFGLRELLARVRAVFRRQEMGRVARTRDPERGGYRFGGWQLERRGRKLVDPNGAQVSLSKGDYALLLAFLDAPQRPLTREQLLQATRVHEDIFDRSIDVQVLRLRRRLEADPSAPKMILTERGVGYILVEIVRHHGFTTFDVVRLEDSLRGGRIHRWSVCHQRLRSAWSAGSGSSHKCLALLECAPISRTITGATAALIIASGHDLGYARPWPVVIFRS